PATCTEKGTTTYTATFDAEWADVQTLDVQDIPAINHDWADATYNFVADGSACTAQRVCQNDAAHVENATAKITSAVKEAATCTVKGWTTYTATFEEDWADVQTLDVQDIPAINHKDTLVQVEAKAATCDEKGWEAYEYCTACDYTTYAEKAALGHDEISHEAKSPTCTEIGWDAYVTCSRCDYTTYAEKAALGHTVVVDKAVAPTCTKTGLTEGSHCDVCGEVLVAQEVVEALGHTWGAWKVTTAATCTENGEERRDCSACDAFETNVLTAAGHKYDAVVTDPTCTAEGFTTYTCSVCDDSYVADKVAALGHTEGEVVVENNVAPDCVNEGSYDNVVYCTVCDAELSRETVTVDALGHKYEAVVTAPTCTEEGFTTYTCSVCDDSYVADKVAALDHTEGEVVVENEVAATCTKEGSYENVVYCTVCDAELSRETITVDALGHTAAEAAKENEVAATCEADGSYDMVVRCAVCKTILSSESFTTDAIGHDYKLDNLVRPTKQTDGTWGNGYETYVCQNDPKHIETKLVERADYTEYDKIVEELEERLEDETLSDEVRAEIEDLLENNKVEPDRIASEQDAVSDAAESIVSGSTSYLKTYKVTFVADGNVISEQTVFYGSAAIAPEAPEKEGFLFTGWEGKYSNVQADVTITATYFEGSVVVDIAADSVKLTVGETKQIAYTVLPADADVELTWTSANTAVATVDEDGVVTGLKNGATTITVTALNGTISETVVVYVYKANAEYTVQLAKSPYGNYVINDYVFYETAYINVKAGQEFKFQFALNSKYSPEDVIVTVNGLELSLGEDNYFTVDCMTENLTIIVIPAPGSGLENGDSDNDNTGTNNTAHSCWCHSSNKLLQFLWKILMFLCKIFGIEKYHYCGCGKAHW
ncbi:MAG: Ig-like domain-containing protein, partial [Clostridia bacterium]|nr:Ig-like domain-containing protein [Clostridia bacterium]